jgi:hypothetical protein
MRAVPAAAVVLLVAWSLLGAGSPEEREQLAQDERLLKAHGIGTDGPALLDFVRKRTLGDADLRRLDELIQQLGDDQFAVRERASRELVRLGTPALPRLQVAARNSDPEVSSRARRCLDEIPAGSSLELTGAAVRLLGERRPAETVAVLLAFLPSAVDDLLEEEVAGVLADVGVQAGRVDRGLVEAARDPLPARRLAAALALARADSAEHRALARQLLQDADPRVRFHAAQALVVQQDRQAVPALIALLTDGPAALAWQAEDLLCRLLGDRPPPAALDSGSAEARRKCRDAWHAWWREHQERLDLAQLHQPQRLLGLNIICDCDVGGPRLGRVWECGTDGKVRWQIEGVSNPADVQLLPNGRLLVAECQGFVVTERDRQGEVHWKHSVKGYPVSCQRLPNGNTFIATYTELLEVTRDGQVVYSHPRPNSIYCAQKLRNGNILSINSHGLVVEIETSGKEVRSVPVGGTTGWAGLEVLPNGHYLIALYSANRVVEIDPSGKEMWRCTVTTPAWATRLRNGHTLVASPDARSLFEFDRNGERVWEQSTPGRPFRVRRR